MFHPHWRQFSLEHADETFDLIVIGGGITGCGIFLDAAQRGLRTLLLEKEDFASGTSSRSSKLIHGGLRYLKQMQFRVTRTASRERDRMLALNPHLVHPIRFLYPANRGDKVPGWTVDLGLWMYDRLANLPEKHSQIEAEEVHRMAPGLDIERLERALAYTDAMADDARLTLAVAATGFAYGGLALTRMEVEEPLIGADQQFTGVIARDLESGEVHPMRGHVVVNATGVWVDSLRQRFGLEGQKVRPSRGSHIVLPSHRLPLEAAVTLPSPDDGRPIFVIPHPEGVIAGTTDIYHDAPLEDPRPTSDEVGYIFRALVAQFPTHALSGRDIIGAFAGLRPILDTHAENPSEASREEEIWEERGLLTIAGGKLTTWRPMAEEVVDEVMSHLPEDRARLAAPCHTKGTPLAALAPPDLAERLQSRLGAPGSVTAAAARRLGATAWRLLDWADSPEELAPLIEGTDLCPAEVRLHLRYRAVLRLEDFLLRRARFGLWTPDLAADLAPRLGDIFRQEMSWDSSRWDRELEQFERALAGWTVRGVQ